MKLSEVLVKPIVSEKANAQQEKLRRYAFRVARKANNWNKESCGRILWRNSRDVNTRGTGQK
jgi:large subunit ribosomal protein L23